MTSPQETVHSEQSTEDSATFPKACCDACAETVRMTREIHAAFTGLATALAGMAKNPMMAAMGRQFGLDPGAIATAMKGE